MRWNGSTPASAKQNWIRPSWPLWSSFPPPTSTARKRPPPSGWPAQTDGISNRAVAFEEMMLLWLANANPAFKPFSELFTDQSLAAVTRYQQITAGLRDYLQHPAPAQRRKS